MDKLLRNTLLILFLLIIVSGCLDANKNKGLNPFDFFYFSFNDTWSKAYFVRFTLSDTIFIYKEYDEDSLKRQKSYFTILSEEQSFKLDSSIKSINFWNLDSNYSSNVVDGINFSFFIKKNNKKKWIHFSKDVSPKSLLNLTNFIRNVLNSSKLKEIKELKLLSEEEKLVPPRLKIRVKFLPPEKGR